MLGNGRETNFISASTTPVRSYRQPRVSPYPERSRTPVRLPNSTAQRSLASEISALRDAPPSSSHHQREAASAPSQAPLYQLKVQPIVKLTVAQRDSSGQVLEDFTAEGNTFNDILQSLWRRFHVRIPARAVFTDGDWVDETPSIATWTTVMQFKFKKHVVDSDKSEQAWQEWLVARRGDKVTLLLYQFGMAIKKKEELDAFIRAETRDRAQLMDPTNEIRAICAMEVTPQTTLPPPRARPTEPLATSAIGAMAVSEIVTRLKSRWSSKYETNDGIWGIWASYIKDEHRDLAPEDAITRPPPSHMMHRFRPAGHENHLQQHVARVMKSARLALDVIDTSLAGFESLCEGLEAMKRTIAQHHEGLLVRKSMIEAWAEDIEPVRPRGA